MGEEYNGRYCQKLSLLVHPSWKITCGALTNTILPARYAESPHFFTRKIMRILALQAAGDFPLNPKSPCLWLQNGEWDKNKVKYSEMEKMDVGDGIPEVFTGCVCKCGVSKVSGLFVYGVKASHKNLLKGTKSFIRILWFASKGLSRTKKIDKVKLKGKNAEYFSSLSLLVGFVAPLTFELFYSNRQEQYYKRFKYWLGILKDKQILFILKFCQYKEYWKDPFYNAKTKSSLFCRLFIQCPIEQSTKSPVFVVSVFLSFWIVKLWKKAWIKETPQLGHITKIFKLFGDMLMLVLLVEVCWVIPMWPNSQEIIINHINSTFGISGVFWALQTSTNSTH